MAVKASQRRWPPLALAAFLLAAAGPSGAAAESAEAATDITLSSGLGYVAGKHVPDRPFHAVTQRLGLILYRPVTPALAAGMGAAVGVPLARTGPAQAHASLHLLVLRWAVQPGLAVHGRFAVTAMNRAVLATGWGGGLGFDCGVPGHPDWRLGVQLGHTQAGVEPAAAVNQRDNSRYGSGALVLRRRFSP